MPENEIDQLDIFEKPPSIWDKIEQKIESNPRLELLLLPLDFLSLCRPLLLVAVWLPALLGFLASSYIDKIIGEETAEFVPQGLGSMFLCVTLLGISVFIINQIYDIKADRQGKKHLPLAEGLLSVKFAWVVYILVSLGAVTLAFFQGILVGFAVVLGVLLGVLYSYPKFSFKDKAWGGLLLNGLGHGFLIFVIGFLWSGRVDWWALIGAIPYFFAYCGVYIFTTIPDMEQDRIFGKNTIAVSLGQRKAAVLAIGFIFFATGISVILKQPALFLTGLFSLPFFGYSFFKGRAYGFANKSAILLLTIFTSFYYFWPFPLVMILAVIVWFHNRMRFKVSYP